MPHKGKASAEEKLRIVEEYLSGKVGYREVCRRAGIALSTLQRWVSRYNTEGPTGFLPAERIRNYSREIRHSAVLDYLTGKGSLLKICEQYKIRSSRQLEKWVKRYNCRDGLKEPIGGSHMTNGRETTIAERLEIVKDCITSGNDYSDTALKYQVSYQQVYSWVKKYREIGEAGLEDRRGHRAGTLPSRTPEEKLRDRIAQLEREKFDLEMENALLKKVRELERRRR